MGTATYPTPITLDLTGKTMVMLVLEASYNDTKRYASGIFPYSFFPNDGTVFYLGGGHPGTVMSGTNGMFMANCSKTSFSVGNVLINNTQPVSGAKLYVYAI